MRVIAPKPNEILAGLWVALVVGVGAMAQIQDIAAPRIVSISVTPVKVYAGDSFQNLSADVRFTDDISGMRTISVSFTSQTGKQSTGNNGTSNSCLISGNVKDGICRIPILVQRFAEIGVWTLSGVFAFDQAGNRLDCQDACIRPFSGAGFVVTAEPQPTPPIGSAQRATTWPGGPLFVAITVVPGKYPTSSGTTVSADLTQLGGAASQRLFDDGTMGDATAGDNVFSFQMILPQSATSGTKNIQSTISDEQGRNATVGLTVSVLSEAPTFRHNRRLP